MSYAEYEGITGTKTEREESSVAISRDKERGDGCHVFYPAGAFLLGGAKEEMPRQVATVRSAATVPKPLKIPTKLRLCRHVQRGGVRGKIDSDPASFGDWNWPACREIVKIGQITRLVSLRSTHNIFKLERYVI